MRLLITLFLSVCIVLGFAEPPADDMLETELRNTQNKLTSAQLVRDYYRDRSFDLEAELLRLELLNQTIDQWEPAEISLPEDLQKYTAALARTYGLPPDLVFAVGQRESRWLWAETRPDTNRLGTVGYMQINQPHWDRLAEMGIDVHDPRGNIHGGIVILAELVDKYPLDKALAAYNAGEAGMRRGHGRGYAQAILAELQQGTP